MMSPTVMSSDFLIRSKSPRLTDGRIEPLVITIGRYPPMLMAPIELNKAAEAIARIKIEIKIDATLRLLLCIAVKRTDAIRHSRRMKVTISDDECLPDVWPTTLLATTLSGVTRLSHL
jgi:hypothetical protein